MSDWFLAGCSFVQSSSDVYKVAVQAGGRPDLLLNLTTIGFGDADIYCNPFDSTLMLNQLLPGPGNAVWTSGAVFFSQ